MLEQIGGVRGAPSRSFCINELEEVFDNIHIGTPLYYITRRWIGDLLKFTDREFFLTLVSLGRLTTTGFVELCCQEGTA